MALPTSPPPAMVISKFSAETGGFGQSCEIVPRGLIEYEENRNDPNDRRSVSSCFISSNDRSVEESNLRRRVIGPIEKERDQRHLPNAN